MERSVLKAAAKESLKGNYLNAILVMVLPELIAMLPVPIISIITSNASYESQITGAAIGGFLSWLITICMLPGITSYFLKVSRGKTTSFSEVFNKFDLCLSFIVMMVMSSIFISLWSLLLIVPGIIAAYRYRLAQYVLVDNPQIGGLGAITKSKELMMGHKMDLFVLDLSFLGWIILTPFTFGLLSFWLVPYMMTTYANFYNSLKGGVKVVMRLEKQAEQEMREEAAEFGDDSDDDF